ncbi:NYN domain-containing protein [Mycobacterium sp. PSTR-4-N]|uniref:NYN domain-containing protein n=1 Tax=Mycobacterium sp. PSTR-4-N TaxID=2917745 RepID=UPI001F14C7ED|nr:NYN domain-containing protein [Mycobacterium sp. PSTR-4-N]MCG7593792.1 NYN domain-containing protein [Mycobacterium sp. PSTR-4-N]
MRWIIDGMNVIGASPDGWWRDRHAAMVRLVHALERWAEADDVEVTVVFEQPPRPPIGSAVVTVAHAPAAAPDSADDEILRVIRDDDRPDDLVVVTSDRGLADRVRCAGATVAPPRHLRTLLQQW